jgi:hypothetical protein
VRSSEPGKKLLRVEHAILVDVDTETNEHGLDVLVLRMRPD